MNSDSAGTTDSSFSQDWILQALGDVAVPGHLADLAESLARRKQNALRLRRGIDPHDLPLPTAAVPWYDLGYLPRNNRAASECTRPSRWLAYATADYYLQDAGSLLALAAAGADGSSLQDSLICDLCAAPGGKASALVEAVDAGGGRGFVLANEVIQSRLGALQLNLARTGSDRYAISNLDPNQLADRLPGVFDVVVVDAPCSGQALIARKKQRLTALSAKQIEHSALRQNRILDAAIRLVRDGGKLVYSTCTFAEAENEAQVARLAGADVAAADRVDRLASYESRPGCYRLWPHLHQCAGSFAASMTATNRHPPKHRRQPRKRRDRDHGLPIELSQWYQNVSDSVRLCARDSVLLGWPVDAPDWVDDIAIGGPELAHRTGKTWKPSHAAALRRISRAQCVQSLDVDDAAAMVYLRGESIPCDGRGWRVVRLRTRPLGWIKGNGSLGKNHLPSAARMPGLVST